ncbi:MAG TPA: DUF296 domain-containing protein [Chloroflexota bacterium]|nr:DUF296 domain-containing protein [Chloroflexota bacterium]
MEFERFGDRYVLRLDPGEEAASTLRAFAAHENIRGGYLVGFGAFSRVRLCYFDVGANTYRPHHLDRQVEVVSLLGSIAYGSGHPMLHLHAAVSDAAARTYSGHLSEGTVYPTLEVFLTRLAGELRRERDPRTGLELLALARSFQPAARAA